MNIIELEAGLPNGFHDATLEKLEIDYQKSVVYILMKLWIGLLPSKPFLGSTPVMRRANLSFERLVYCVVEPPEQLGDSDHEELDVSGCENVPENPNVRLPTVAEGVFRYAFYVSDWNSFIHIAARTVGVTWLESEESAWSRAKEQD
ncbi:hypothetical protein [Pendulispora albinea]|uniref:Uncharacterized protein n=1 Tax=Pendulispora albinea TaxID=2741071 RepID=A0ABZ2LU56_9BACT